MIAFTGLEAAASIAGEVRVGRQHIRRLVLSGSAVIVVIYVGIAFVAISALPVHHGVSDLGVHHVRAPVLGVVEALHPHWLAQVLKYAVAIGGALGLTAAAGSSMLGVSRVGYSMATNRQIPSAAGRLSSRWGTPVVVIAVASIGAAALILPRDLELLIGIYAFGALVAFTIAHVSVIVLRFREPDRPRAYAVPAVGGGARDPGAAAGGARGGALRRRAHLGPHLSQRSAVPRPRLAARRSDVVRLLPPHAGQAGVQTRHDPGARAAA